MKSQDLEKLNDEQLAEMIETAQTMLKDRKEQRKKDAIEAARATLAGAGLTFSDAAKFTAPAATRSRSRGNALQAGKRYVNPADPSQVWESKKGRRPLWVQELQKKGQLQAEE